LISGALGELGQADITVIAWIGDVRTAAVSSTIIFSMILNT